MKKLLSKLESSGVAEADSYSNLDAESLKLIYIYIFNSLR